MRKLSVNERGLETLFGAYDENLKILEQAFRVKITARGTEITLRGDPTRTRLAARLIEQLSELAERGHILRRDEVELAVRFFRDNGEVSLARLLSENRLKAAAMRKEVIPKSPNQRLFLEAMRQHDMVFAIGPAGTGKTYLAVAMAVSSLLERRVNRIVLARPAVEAGEKLGYLPGDMVEKVNPYLRPLYDALYDLLDRERADSMLARGTIEIAPLAFMRGRTLNDSFVILDEAQNTTSEQMKMLLTRIGTNSKAVIIGDVTQIDLPHPRVSGLVEAQQVVGEVPGIVFVYLDDTDVVRHDLVQSIIRAYENYNGNRSSANGGNAAETTKPKQRESTAPPRPVSK
ncbi:MAG: PhoH family protein [Acidobacteriota bacterium]